MDTSKRVNFFVICENHITDILGRTSLINIFDVIFSPEFPFTPTKFYASFSVNLKDEDLTENTAKFKLEVIDPDHKVLATWNGQTGKISPRQRTVINSIDLAGQVMFAKEHKHQLKLYINDSHVSTNVFEVKATNKEVEK
jgi:hypothetical protein